MKIFGYVIMRQDTYELELESENSLGFTEGQVCAWVDEGFHHWTDTPAPHGAFVELRHPGWSEPQFIHTSKINVHANSVGLYWRLASRL